MSMMTEAQLTEAVGLVVRHGYGRRAGFSVETLFGIERELLMLGVQLNSPVGPPEPTAPDGGRTLALREAA